MSFYKAFSLAVAFTTTCLPSSAIETVENKPEPCYIVANLKQSRFSLNPFQHMKDGMNSTDFRLPTACATSKNIKVGDKLVDKFRTGSLLLSGSLSDWNLNVKEVPSFKKPEESSCRATLKLSQSRFSINPLSHLKDAANSLTFKWDMPCSIYDQIQPGDNLINKSFRWGSLIVDQSTSSWSLTLQQKHGFTP